MSKPDLSAYKKDKKPIAKLLTSEQTLGGDARHINPVRKMSKEKPKQSFFKKLFS